MSGARVVLGWDGEIGAKKALFCPSQTTIFYVFWWAQTAINDRNMHTNAHFLRPTLHAQTIDEIGHFGFGV